MAARSRLRSFGGMTDIPVRLDHVTKRYGPTVAVDDLSFEIRPGAVHTVDGAWTPSA